MNFRVIRNIVSEYIETRIADEGIGPGASLEVKLEDWADLMNRLRECEALTQANGEPNEAEDINDLQELLNKRMDGVGVVQLPFSAKLFRHPSPLAFDKWLVMEKQPNGPKSSLAIEFRHCEFGDADDE